MPINSLKRDRMRETAQSFTEIEGERIQHEYPAIEGLLYGLGHMNPPRYDKRDNPVPEHSYLSHHEQRPIIASAMRDNLLNSVMFELQNQGFDMRDGVDHVVESIAAGASAIEEREYAYRSAGLLKQSYGNDDIVEHRYALAARLLAQKQRQDDEEQQRQNGKHDGQQQRMVSRTMEKQDGSREKQDISDFVNYILRLEPFMPIISKYIDKSLGIAPTERIQHTKIYDDDGEKIDIVDFDIDDPNNITVDSLAWLAHPDQKITTMMLDDLTGTRRYTEETKKYIDVFVVDQSGSMDHNQNIVRAAAYLYNRLEKVIKGWAMLALVEFHTEAYVIELPKELAGDEPRWLINTPEKALYMQQDVINRYLNFSGGGTNIPAGVYMGVNLSLEMQKHGGILPNITVITDDDTSITRCDKKLIKGIPVNGLAVTHNQYMESFCIDTGGKYYPIDAISLDPNLIMKNSNGGIY